MPETGTTPASKSGRVASQKRRAKQGTAKEATLTIQQVRSGICCSARHKRILKALGLRRPNQRVVRPDNPAVRGMVKAIPHLVRILEA